MIDRLKITHLYTIPTVMKFLMKAGDEHVEKYSLSSLKVVTLGNQSFYFARTNVPLIGASLSEPAAPHTSVTALRTCVCMSVCLFAAIYRKF